MLTVLTARAVRPEIEAIDRDPGIVTLLSGLARAAHRGLTRCGAYHRVANETALFSSAMARPHIHR